MKFYTLKILLKSICSKIVCMLFSYPSSACFDVHYKINEVLFNLLKRISSFGFWNDNKFVVAVVILGKLLIIDSIGDLLSEF